MKILMLTTILFLIAMGCNTAESGVSASDTGETSISPTLQIAGQIGIELGDTNFVFGVIQDVDFTPDGNVAILDAQKKQLFLFTPEAEFIGSAGGQGEAPGEFLNPRSVAALSDGRIAVSDPFSREVEIFTADLYPSETISDFNERAPFVIAAGDEGGFIGEQGGFDRESGILVTRVVSWDLELDSQFVHHEIEDDFRPEDLVNRIMSPPAGLAFSNGRIYYAPPVAEQYQVQVFSFNETEEAPLSFPGYSPVEKSDEDIQSEIDAYEARMQAMASSGRGARLAEAGYSPPEHYYATASIGTDREGRIWVQRGWESDPVFDLFNPGDQEPSQTVRVSDDLNLTGYTFIITPNGIAAFHPDPEDYPRVLLMEINQPQEAGDDS